MTHWCQLKLKCLSHRRFTPLSLPDALGGKRNPVPSRHLLQTPPPPQRSGSPIYWGGLGWGNAVSDEKPKN
jgi:hypothetical protein